MNEVLRRTLGRLAPDGRPTPRILSLLRDSSRAGLTMDDFYCRLERQEEERLPPLDPEDCYHEGDGGRFVLSWPLSPYAELPDRFDRLDRAAQFSLLLAEWQRRESEARLCLSASQLDDAELLFQECLARARQLAVDELEARSFDGLHRVAERRGQRQSASEWARRAEAARCRG